MAASRHPGNQTVAGANDKGPDGPGPPVKTRGPVTREKEYDVYKFENDSLGTVGVRSLFVF